MKKIKLKLYIDKLSDSNYMLNISNDKINCDDGWFQFEFRQFQSKVQFSKISCFFTNPLFYYTSTDDIQSKIDEITNYINSIKTGSNIQEGRFKIRKYFGCHEGIPNIYNSSQILGYINYVGYDKPWGDKNNYGFVKLVKFEDKNIEIDTFIRTYTIEYTPNAASYDAIIFEILCFQYNAYHLIAKYYNNWLPQHLVFGNTIDAEIENFIINEISKIRFSTLNELLIKLSIFSHSIMIDDVAKAPITEGDIVEYHTDYLKFPCK